MNETSDILTPAPLDDSLRRRLRRVIGRLRTCVVVEGAAWVAGFLLAAAVLTFVLDYGARGLQRSMRVTLLVLIGAGLVWLIWRRLIGPLRLRVGAAEAAKLIERHYPSLSSSLLSAVRFAGGEIGRPALNSPELMRSVITRANRQTRNVDFDAVVRPKRARWSGLFAGAVVLIATTAAVAAPRVTSLWFQRIVLLREVPWPKRTHLFVELDGDELIGARGDDLSVSAWADGVRPREVDIVFETASGKPGRETMVTVGSGESFRYRHTFKNAQEDFTFYLEGGDDRTGVYSARLLERPRVTRTRMRIDPPPYTRREAFELGDGRRAVSVLPGSEVTIWIETNKPVRRATLSTGNEPVVEAKRAESPSTPEGDGPWVASFVPVESHTYHFALLDDVGLDNRRPVRFSVRVTPDEPPTVRMTLTGAGDMITPQAVLPIGLECTDTYGLASVELEYSIAREPVAHGRIDVAGFTRGMTHFSTTMDWPVSSVGVEPADRLSLAARAADENDVTGPSVADAPERVLRVVTRDELLSELARREQEYRLDFERVIDAQEQLRGSLLTVFGRFQEGMEAGALAAALTPLERRQRNVAGSVNVLRQQFEQILSELRINQLDTAEERQRLEGQIIGPLSQLSKRDLVAAADTIRHWSREATGEQASKVDPQQVAILSQMRSIRASMIQWEGYQEVVNMLRDIIRLQQELQTETKEALQRQAGEVFDDDQ